MSVEKGWQCSCDIEIAFPDISFGALKGLAAGLLPNGYSIEDKSDRGWGCVISLDHSWQGDRRQVSGLIVEFIELFRPIIISVVKNQANSTPIVRLGVYHSTWGLTLLLSKTVHKCLGEMDVELEISTYPSDDDETSER